MNNDDPEVRFSRSGSDAAPEIVVGGLVALATAGVVWCDSKHSAVFGWLVLMLSVYAVRLWAEKKPDRRADADGLAHRHQWLAPGMLLTGFLWGLASSFALWSDGAGLATMSLLGGSFLLAVFALGNYLGARVALMPFTLGLVVPPVITGMARQDATGVAVAVFSAAATVAVLAASWKLDRFVREGISIQSERDDLYWRGRLSRQLIQRLELGVKTSGDRQTQLKGALDDAQSKLEVATDKADALSSALQRAMPYDVDTGLLKAKKFYDVLKREWSRMLRQEMPITLVYMALDNFDGYRQTYGKLAYENMLRHVSKVLRGGGNRPGDVTARLSEDGFALLFPEAGHENGNNLAELVRVQLRRLNAPNANSPLHAVITASFGVSTIIPTSGVQPEALCKRAAAALDEARCQGGDKVVWFPTMMPAASCDCDCDREGDLIPLFHAQGDRGECRGDPVVSREESLGVTAEV